MVEYPERFPQIVPLGPSGLFKIVSESYPHVPPGVPIVSNVSRSKRIYGNILKNSKEFFVKKIIGM